MKKVLGLLILMTFVFSGCVGTKWRRGVQGNTFYSTYPEVAIEIAPGFEYVDKTKTSETASGPDIEHSSNTTLEQFLFANRVTQQAALIRINRLEGARVYWVADIASQVSNYVSTGYEDHFGKTYQYVVLINKDNNGDCKLVKWLSRVVGGNGETLLTIFYTEPMEDFSIDCNEKLKIDHFTLQQKDFYDAFMENSSKNMKFIDVASLNLEKKD